MLYNSSFKVTLKIAVTFKIRLQTVLRNSSGALLFLSKLSAYFKSEQQFKLLGGKTLRAYRHDLTERKENCSKLTRAREDGFAAKPLSDCVDCPHFSFMSCNQGTVVFGENSLENAKKHLRFF